MMVLAFEKPSREAFGVNSLLENFINQKKFISVESGCDAIGLDDSFHNLQRMLACLP